VTQISQLSEAEIEARFHVTGARPVGFMLAGYAKDGVQFTIQFGGGADLFLTTLLAVIPERNLLIFDCSGSQDMNRRLLAGDRALFIGRPGGIHVQFAVGRVQETIYAGARAFAVALPAHVVRLQRREYFRIDTPRARPLEFFGRLAGEALRMPAHDLSVVGVALTAPQPPAGIEPGQTLDNCHFALPEDKHELFFNAVVRHVTRLEGRSGMAQWRIGLQITNLPTREENRIQRYIARVERERHELSG
jgi:c-di-GMP-binding flagellar brake protein YcgR